MTVTTVDPERRTNAAAIADAVRLGYLTPYTPTWDATFGEFGAFWTGWRPDCLLRTDLDPRYSPGATAIHPSWETFDGRARDALAGGVSIDAADTPFPDEAFGCVVLDGPYKLNGTSTGRGPSASDGRYGVSGDYQPWQARHGLIRAMISEAARLVSPDGTLLVKCMDQVCSGRKRWQTIEFAEHAERLGLRLVDELLVFGGRAQPSGRSQRHAHGNVSSLMIFEPSRTGWRSPAAQRAFDAGRSADTPPRPKTLMEVFADEALTEVET